MREIKFRAWSKREKYMYKWRQIHNAGSLDDMIADKDVILRQYTGLKDRNHKRIYEGDILSYELKQGWEIFFEDGCYYMMCGGRSFLLEKVRTQISEIIGNIHENPELLEAK
ncbi:MAG: hypothetical protein E3J87_09125 [Candidatus Cloacimonadota bacterium]|nr:MAG: hypothetical protein E3J87_09125 [Candidatus Cloacimonadota bacterium]